MTLYFSSICMGFPLKLAKHCRVREIDSNVLMSVGVSVTLFTCIFCTIIIENEITAEMFTLSSFDLWSQQVELAPMEKANLQKLIGMNVYSITLLEPNL